MASSEKFGSFSLNVHKKRRKKKTKQTNKKKKTVTSTISFNGQLMSFSSSCSVQQKVGLHYIHIGIPKAISDVSVETMLQAFRDSLGGTASVLISKSPLLTEQKLFVIYAWNAPSSHVSAHLSLLLSSLLLLYRAMRMLCCDSNWSSLKPCGPVCSFIFGSGHEALFVGVLAQHLTVSSASLDHYN